MSDEQKLLLLIKDLKPFETLEIKRDDKGELVYVYTQKSRGILHMQ